MRRANSVRTTGVEEVALEVFIVAFATMSRVAEICALTVDDVSPEGDAISLRTKTFAKTCLRHVKRVANGCGLFPVNILLRRKMQAQLEGRKLIFSEQRSGDVPLSSASVTSALKQVCKKTRTSGRITSHSARKGAAVSTLMAGIPLVVIQSLGLWACADSLQSYLGRAVREKLGVLEIIDGAGGQKRANLL